MAAARTDDLAAIVAALDAEGRLARVRSEADPRHEIAGIAHALNGASAVLFERPRGHRWPVLAGLHAHRAAVAAMFGCDPAQLARHVAARIGPRAHAPLLVAAGPVLDVTEPDADLGKLPVPMHTPKDGGACVTAAILIAKDPETGARLLALPQLQLMGRDSLRLQIEPGGAIEVALEKARRLGRSMWVTLNVGTGLGLQIAAAMPGAAAGDELLAAAGGIDGAPVALIPGLESDVEIVAAAMWALECEIVPGETGRAGPFPALAGHYAAAGACPVVHVRRVHRRAAPVFHTIMPGRDARGLAGLAGEIHLIGALRRQVPGVEDACFTAGGGHFHHAVVQIAARAAAAAKPAILAAFAAFPPLKMVTVVDETVNIRDAAAVEGALASRFEAATGLVRIEMPESAGGTRLGFDAAQPPPRRADLEAIAFKAVALEKHTIDSRDAEPRAPSAPVAPQAILVAPAAVVPHTPSAAGENPAPILSAPEETTPALKPDQTADWDENRWLQRELEAMRGSRQESVATTPPEPAPSAQAVADAGAAARKTDDWDEDRWLKRELEAMQRERETKAPAAPPVHRAARPENPRAAVQTMPEGGKVADAEDGGFFGAA